MFTRHKYRLSRKHMLLVFTASVILLAAISGCMQTRTKWEYPEARRGDVVDDYFGTKVADPYRWLEDADSPETQAWVEAENRLLRSYVDTPAREKALARLTALYDYPRCSDPRLLRGRYAYERLQNQSVLYIQDGPEGTPRVVIDPNTLSADGTAALSSYYYTPDGSLLAYGVSLHGSDEQEIHIRNVETGEDYAEVLKWCRFAAVAWHPDRSGFYYDRFPERGSVPEEDRVKYNRVYWHKLGTPQAEDKLVYEYPEDKDLGFSPLVTDDGRYLCLFVWRGTNRANGLYLRPLASDGPFETLFPEGKAVFDVFGNVGSTFYVRTDLNAPNCRIVTVDLEKPAPENWREVVPEQDNAIQRARLVNGMLVVDYLKDAHDFLEVHSLQGGHVRDIELPALGSVERLQGENRDREIMFEFTSFTFPTRIYRYDLAENELTLFRDAETDFDASAYETKQVFFPSKDGTQVPMFITYKKGLELNGENPTLLYGYGGFTVNMTPYFSPRRIYWLEQGGVFVLVTLRGGNEYGERWHRAGMLENKQNVFDDFIAAAEWLIANKYTRTEKLAIKGGSNGGLLVAACMVQRPDLFGAVVAQVPVIDMLRYQKFTVGSYWTGEYGDAEKSADQFNFLYAYSPLHNIKPGTVYPATLVTTADTDDRVVPMHGKKFAAALQAADAGVHPILLRVDTKAGHGAGKPMTKYLEEQADIYAFLFNALHMQVQ